MNGVTNFEGLTPTECIEKMFEHGKNGSVLVPSFIDGYEEKGTYSVTLKPEWNSETLVSEFRFLYAVLKEIAPHYDTNRRSAEEMGRKLGSEELFGVWEKYLRDFDANDGTFYALAPKLNDGESLSEEEQAWYGNYRIAVREEAKERIGGELAYEFIMEARRVCRLMYYGAPKIVITEEAKKLALALVINRCAAFAEIER